MQAARAISFSIQFVRPVQLRICMHHLLLQACRTLQARTNSTDIFECNPRSITCSRLLIPVESKSTDPLFVLIAGLAHGMKILFAINWGQLFRAKKVSDVPLYYWLASHSIKFLNSSCIFHVLIAIGILIRTVKARSG
jgi:hypothetical protein